MGGMGAASLRTGRGGMGRGCDVRVGSAPRPLALGFRPFGRSAPEEQGHVTLRKGETPTPSAREKEERVMKENERGEEDRMVREITRDKNRKTEKGEEAAWKLTLCQEAARFQRLRKDLCRF